jgi:hypothetical protein
LDTIRFRAVLNGERAIQLPEGLYLPSGAVEVTVRPIQESTVSKGDDLAPTRAWLLALVAEAERANPDLPSDMAEQHDHYAHGKPRS